jgi:hypothetical protein
VPVPREWYATTAWTAWALAGYRPRAARLLLETYRARQVCTDPSRRFPLPHRPLAYAQALALLEG